MFSPRSEPLRRRSALVDVGNLTKAEELTKRGIAEARAIPYARTEAALLLIDGDKQTAAW